MNRFSFFAAVVAISASSLAFGANLLTDPGFELNSVTSDSNVLNSVPFTTYAGQWGQEDPSIVPVDGGITPFQGKLQLKMDPAGTGNDTQAFQTVDVSSFAAAIDSNTAYVTASAYLNSGVSAAIAGVYVSYFNGSDYSYFTGYDQSILNLDASTSTWELNSLTKLIPAGTRWLLFQVAYDNNSLSQPNSDGTVGGYGYVDATSLTIDTRGVSTPTPAAWMGGLVLLGLTGMATTRRMKVSDKFATD